MLKEIDVRPVEAAEETRYQQLMQARHYLGGNAQDQRNAVVCGQLGRRLSSAAEFFCGGLEVRGARSLDRLELSASV